MNRSLVLPLRPIFSILCMLIAVSCAGSQPISNTVQVQILVDQQMREVSLPEGSTVSDAIRTNGIELNLNDKVAPPGYTVLTDGMVVMVTRVTESSEIEHKVLPFERQILKNESIPKGEMRLLQPGKNGLEEITYRVIEEGGIETSRVAIRHVILEEPVPEIMMVGTQQGYAPFTFPGTIVYVSSQNAWLINGATGARRPIVSTGDLDGRIFELSPDCHWLLFTRQFNNLDNGINSLWMLDITDPQAEPLDLNIQNIIHFADWSPQSPTASGTYILAYSTVEPRPSAPGWHANNDLHLLEITDAGTVVRRAIILETNSGGQYGWWGSTFSWSPEADLIAYSRADSIGLVNLEEGTTEELIKIVPYETGGDWAWLPPFSWGASSEILYFVNHGEPIGLEKREASPMFDVMALYRNQSTMGPILHRSGMFSYLAFSPHKGAAGQGSYALALLRAVDPLESQVSHYQLMVMDCDGSNQQSIFPEEGELGLEPGEIIWAPNGSQIAAIYQKDLWVMDLDLGLTHRITSDGQIIAFDWSQ